MHKCQKRPTIQAKETYAADVRGCELLAVNYLCTCCQLLVYLLSTTCVLAVNYMCTCCQLHVYLVSTTCVLAFNYMCTCCQLLVYLLSTTSVLAVNYLCVCVCLCVSVLHINITLWFVEGCVPVAVKGVPILLKRGWQC